MSGFPPGGVPDDVDDETFVRITHSFYVVRMVRYGLLLFAFVVLLLATLAEHVATVVTVGLGVVVAGLVVALVATRRRYVAALSRPRPGSPPTGPPASG